MTEAAMTNSEHDSSSPVEAASPRETPRQTARERDPLDELREAIEKFADAQFALGNSPPSKMLASLDQARTAHDALWRIITRILEAATALTARLAELEGENERLTQSARQDFVRFQSVLVACETGIRLQQSAGKIVEAIREVLAQEGPSSDDRCEDHCGRPRARKCVECIEAEYQGGHPDCLTCCPRSTASPTEPADGR